MKLTPETLSIFKNFASISSGLFVPGGQKIRVKNATQDVLAEANVVEDFPSFCVADLAKFLGLLTVDKDVDVDFAGSDIVLSLLSGRSKIKYRASPKNLVNIPKDTDYTIPQEDAFAEFTLTKDTLNYTEKVLSLLSLGHVAFEYDGSKFFIRVFDPQNDGENQQELDIEGASVANVSQFQIIFPAGNLNFVPGDYKVLLAEGRAQFKHTTLDVTYWLAPHAESNISR